MVEAKIRAMQQKLLKLLAERKTSFALAGGTALELYYLHHRFSRDIDLFSANYNLKEISQLVSFLSKGLGKAIKLESQFTSSNHARVCFYVMQIERGLPLKIDFVEDVLFPKPKIRKFRGVSVYDARQIYFQKIAAIVGTRIIHDDIGREMPGGRGEIRDVIDLYYLSREIEPLHLFLNKMSREFKRAVIQWHHTFSRQEFKLGFLDFELYDKKLDSQQIINCLEGEIKKFLKGEIQ